MTRIYTRTGDRGETALLSGERLPKDSLRVEAYGTVDELSSWIGYARSLIEDQEIVGILDKTQRDLFSLGADLATRSKGKTPGADRVTDSMVRNVEEDIDKLDAELTPLSTFIIPVGTKAASALHVARAIARRAERRTVTLAGNERLNPQIIPYLNRLSSLLFVLARVVNKRSGVEESRWASRLP